MSELVDHLYCEIDRARATGLSDEEAFRTATARLGSASDLLTEDAKNRSVVCRVAAKIERPGVSLEGRRILLGHSLIWAALMIATSLMLAKTSMPSISSMLLIGVFVPMWWASDQLVRKALSRPRESR